MRLSILLFFLIFSLFPWGAVFGESFEKEPNDAFYQATPLLSGVAISGKISSRSTTDWFSINSLGEDTITVTFENDKEVTGVYSVKIVDEDENILAKRRHSLFQYDSIPFLLTAKIERSGTYYVSVSGLPTINYELKATVEKPTDAPGMAAALVDDDIRIHAVIMIGEHDAVDALWLKGDEAAKGNNGRVMWGHFFANPREVSWEGGNFPELFLKYVEEGGIRYVDLSHVSNHEIIINIDHPYDESIDQRITLTTDNRFYRYVFPEAVE